MYHDEFDLHISKRADFKMEVATVGIIAFFDESVYFLFLEIERAKPQRKAASQQYNCLNAPHFLSGYMFHFKLIYT